jgi:hypothetical protein
MTIPNSQYSYNDFAQQWWVSKHIVKKVIFFPNTKENPFRNCTDCCLSLSKATGFRQRIGRFADHPQPLLDKMLTTSFTVY